MERLINRYMKTFQELILSAEKTLEENLNKTNTVDKIVLALELTEVYLGRKLNKGEITNFTDIILEADEIIAKKKDDGTIFKKGKYTIEIMTSEGKLIRTATSQKGILDVIHGERSYRVLDGNNRDITAKLKTFIKQKQKQEQLKKKYAKKKKLNKEENEFLSGEMIMEGPPVGGLKGLMSKVLLGLRLIDPVVPHTVPAIEAPAIKTTAVAPATSRLPSLPEAPIRPTSSTLPGAPVEPPLVRTSTRLPGSPIEPSPVRTTATVRASDLLAPETPAARTLRPQSTAADSPIQDPVKEPIKDSIKDTIKASETIKEPIKEPVKEPIKEPVREPAKEPVKANEPPKEPVKETEISDGLGLGGGGGAGSAIFTNIIPEIPTELEAPINIFKKRQIGMYGVPVNY